MKQFKSLIALVLAVMMALALCGTALAEGEGGESPAAETPATPTNNLTKDTSVTVTGLDAGDKVAFYKMIEWVDGTGWAWTSAATTAATAASVTLPELTVITGKLDTTKTPAEFVAGVISAANGAIIAKAAAKMTAVDTIDASNGSATLNTTTSGVGLYCALVTPGTPDNLYNPIFVSSDFSQKETSPNTQEASLSASYSDTALVKKESVTLKKEIDGTTALTGDTKYDVNVGDTVNFTITSKVPAFSEAYIDPVYELTDTLEKGLVVKGTPSVTVGELNLSAGTDYKVTVAEDSKSFKVEMLTSGIAAVRNAKVAQDITVTYSATVTAIDEDKWNINEKDNTATVKFSNNPGDKTKYGLLEDKTRNYTFTIDGNLLGKTFGSWETSELIKIGKNADGTDLTKVVNYKSGTSETPLSPLEGAEFQLKKGEAIYKNTVFDGTKITSDENGRLLINGLDAGTYTLTETKAPDGFIKDTRTFTITITPTYKTIPAGSYDKDGITVKYDSYEVLESYTVAVYDGSNTVTSSYTAKTDATEQDATTHIDLGSNVKVTETVVSAAGYAGDVVTPINNTRGTELPSTGGIGTTIFYVAGIVLVLGAAAIIIARRKAEQE